jgi:tRNA uridine 5-carboxymethylaminomethyl modification enzyme
VSDPQVAQQVEIQAKYAGYIEKQNAEVEKSRRHEELVLPQSLDYRNVPGLSAEVREKLIHVRPATLGQATRIPGVTPAAVSLLLMHLKKRGHEPPDDLAKSA